MPYSAAGTVKMSLSSIYNYQLYNNLSVNRSQNTSLNYSTNLKSSMISRVNGANSGCGSCGKK